MASEKEMEDPWPGLFDKLVCDLRREDIDTFVDCLRNKFPSEWRKKELGDRKAPKMEIIRKFIDYLSEEYGQSGFLKLMLEVSNKKKRNLRNDGENILLHDYLKDCEEKLIGYENYCKEKGILKSYDFVGRKEEMKTVKELLFRKKDQIAGTWISGMGGTGKTTLANQVCGMQGQYRKLYVDLKTTSTVDDFYGRLLGPLDIPPPQQDQKICWETIYEELLKEKSDVVLYLDSFETLLSPNNPNTEVWKILREILSIENSKVKLLITSVHSPDACMPGRDTLENMEHYELRLFTQVECNQLIKRVAPEIIRDPKQKKNIETTVSKMCGFNTLAVQAVFNFLKNYSDCISLEKFLANDKQQLTVAEKNDQQTSQVISTLERVFDGLNDDTQAALVKLSLCNGVQFDFTLAQYLLGEDGTATCTLYSLVKAHLLQIEVKDKASTAGQKIDDEDTRFFLHSLLQNILKKKHATGDFEEAVKSAESNLRAYIKKKLLELGEIKSPESKVGVIGSELQSLVVKFCSMPSIVNEQPDSYNKAAHFQASLQHFLNRKNLEQFYADEASKCKPGQELKWIFLKLSQVEVLLKKSISDLETARVMLYKVKEELATFTIDPPPQALKLTWAHFNLVQGQYHSLCENSDEGIKLIKKALKVYENTDGCNRQAARALNAIGEIHGMKNDPHSIRESMGYYERAYNRLGASTLHFDLIVYSMNSGFTAHILGGYKKSEIENVKKTKSEISPECDKEMKGYFEKATFHYKLSMSYCEKLKMKRSLEYIQLLRQKALLLADSDDIKTIEEAVKLAEKSYELLQEYDKTDMVHMAQCCIAIAQAHKRLGSKMFDAKEDYAKDAYRVPLGEAYHKFKRGFEFMKKGKIFADMRDYYGWPDSLQETMKWLNIDKKKRDRVKLDIESYIKTNVHERKANAPRTQMKSVKRLSVDSPDEDMPRKRRGSIPDRSEMDVSAPVSRPNRAYLKEKRHSVSDDLPMGGLSLDSKHMETCPEEKPTVIAKCRNAVLGLFWQRPKAKKTVIGQVQKDADDLSDGNSSRSAPSEKDSALTGYSKSSYRYSKSGSSTDMDFSDNVGVQQSPSRSSPQKYRYPQASVSHAMVQFGIVPEIKVTDAREEDSDSLDLLPFDHYVNTDSPDSKVKQWLASDDSFHSTIMDVQENA